MSYKGELVRSIVVLLDPLALGLYRLRSGTRCLSSGGREVLGAHSSASVLSVVDTMLDRLSS